MSVAFCGASQNSGWIRHIDSEIVLDQKNQLIGVSDLAPLNRGVFAHRNGVSPFFLEHFCPPKEARACCTVTICWFLLSHCGIKYFIT